jgi:hypothetical protein
VGEQGPRRDGLAGCGRRQLVQHGNREPRTPRAHSQPMHVPPPSCPIVDQQPWRFLHLGSFVQEHAR